MKHVVESGMYFGDYPDDAFFSIENSSLHQYIGEGIKTVEFILLYRDKNIFLLRRNLVVLMLQIERKVLQSRKILRSITRK